MKVTAVLNTPVNPTELFYRDQAVAVVYFPRGLEKDRYTGTANHIGVFYDNTNTAQTADVKSALNEIVGLDNAAEAGDTGSTNDTLSGTISLADRNLFNPNGSNYNIEVQGFLFFFGSMFFTFATIGMVPRLRLTHALDQILLEGTPWDIIVRLVPYGACLAVSFIFGMAILRLTGDMVFRESPDIFVRADFLRHDRGHDQRPVWLDSGESGHCVFAHDSLYSGRLHFWRSDGADFLLSGLGALSVASVSTDLGISFCA